MTTPKDTTSAVSTSKDLTATKPSAKAATAPKGRPTPRRAAAKPKNPGEKPKFAVIEHTLKCQTSEGEVSLDLRIPLDRFEKMTELDGMSEKDSLPFIRTEIMPDDVREPIMGLRDGAESMVLIMKWIEAVGVRFDASLGELDGSSAS